MALVFLENNGGFGRAVSTDIISGMWNTNDTYLISAGDRHHYKGSDTIHSLLSVLRNYFTVNILMQEFTANNYYVHIGDFDKDQIESGEGKALFTCIFELSEATGSEVKVDTSEVQPLPTLQVKW